MSITTCQKVTLISCSVLCVSLFLPRMLMPRGKKETGQPEVGPGFHPSVRHQLSFQEDPEQWAVETSYSLTHGAETMAKFKGIGRGKKYNLMAQVIPLYGFGIFLYIFYIIYKLTCKGRAAKSGKCTTATNPTCKLYLTATNRELTGLQERLTQCERMTDSIVSGRRRSSGCGRRRKSKTSTSKKEEKLLRQLRQITQLMQEGRLEGASPEMEAEEVPYGADWEGYPEETYPVYDDDNDKDDRPRSGRVVLTRPPEQPTAEALAERMELEEEDGEEEDKGDAEEDSEEEVEEEEEMEEEAEKQHLLSHDLSQPIVERKQERLGLEVSRELQSSIAGKKQISFSDHRDVFHYPKEENYEEEEKEEEEEEDGEEEEEEEEEEDDDEGTAVEEEEEADEDDPVMEAESLQFSCEGGPNLEEEAEQNYEESWPAAEEGDGGLQAEAPKEVQVSGLRMRNRRET